MKQSIGRNTAMLTISKMLTLLISLITSMLLARFRTLGEYGTYSQIQMIVSLAIVIAMMGLPNSISYFYSRADTVAERDRFINTYFSFGTLLAVLAGGLLVALLPIWTWYFKNDGISSFTCVLALLPWTKVFIGSMSNMLVAAGKTKRLVVYNLANSGCLLGIIALTQWIGQNFYFYMVLYICVECSFALWVYVEAIRLCERPRCTLDKKMLKAILAFSVPVGLASVVGTINVELDKLMIGRLMDTEALAIYTNAGKELPLTMIATSFTAVLLPYLARAMKNGQAEDGVRLWGKTTELTYVIMAFFVAALVVFAPQVMTVLYSEKYLAGVQVFQIYSLILICRITYFGMILNVTGKTRVVFWCSVFSLALNIVLNYPFYLWMGMAGPAVASFISIGTINIGQMAYSARILKIPFRRFMPWKRLGIITLVNIGMGCGMAAIVWALRLDISVRGIAIAIGLGMAWMAIYALIYGRRLKQLWKQLNQHSE
ncbi:colanic acid exporter [uncultured Clostridium sp.]|nr:colanic acid exporter [uncultured Clostridium sp.]